MANIQKNGKYWHLYFRFGGLAFKPSLKTTSQRVAEDMRGQVEETIKLLETGRIVVPAGANRKEVLNFILSGGKITNKPAVRFGSERQVTLNSVIDEYFADYTVGKAQSTVAGERIHMDHFQRLLTGKTPFDDIDHDTLQKYVSRRGKEMGLRGKKVSPETVKKEFRTFAQVWKMAKIKNYVEIDMPRVQFDLIDEKPPFMTWNQIEEIIKRGGLSDGEHQQYWDCLFLDEQQVLKLLEDVQERAEHPFIHAAVAVAAFTGARRSEIIASRIEDWDFERKIVSIRGRKDSRKVRTTFRQIPMHPELMKIMRGWLDNHHPGSPYMIAVPGKLPRSKTKSEKPSQMTKDQAHNQFKDTLKETNWKVLRGWHILRHSFCSNCARRNVPDLIIDAWMGHKGDEAIKKRYRHLFPSDERLMMEKLFAAK